MADSSDPARLASPRIFLVRMLVFLVLCGLIAFVLQRQIINAFNANPWLNGLILTVLLIGIVLSFLRVIRLFPEVSWVNSFRRADPGLAVDRSPILLAPMASILGDRVGRMAMSPQAMRGIVDSIANRLDAFWERNLSPWDMAAGILMLREAGGFVTDLDGRDDMFGKAEIIAGNETMHRELLALIKAAARD